MFDNIYRYEIKGELRRKKCEGEKMCEFCQYLKNRAKESVIKRMGREPKHDGEFDYLIKQKITRCAGILFTLQEEGLGVRIKGELSL